MKLFNCKINIATQKNHPQKKSKIVRQQSKRRPQQLSHEIVKRSCKVLILPH